MGKIRAKKTSRVHLKASQLTSVTVGADATANFPKPLTKNEDGVHKVDTSANNTSSYGYATSLPPIKIDANPFSGIKIKKDLVIKQQLTYPDPPRITTPKTALAVPKKKKERRKFKREQFLKRLKEAEVIKAEHKKAIQRAKTPVVGDMTLLKDALPDLFAPKKSKTKDKPKKRKKKLNKKNKHKEEKKKQYYGLAAIQDFQNFLKQNNDITDLKNDILKTIKKKSL